MGSIWAPNPTEKLTWSFSRCSSAMGFKVMSRICMAGFGVPMNWVSKTYELPFQSQPGRGSEFPFGFPDTSTSVESQGDWITELLGS